MDDVRGMPDSGTLGETASVRRLRSLRQQDIAGALRLKEAAHWNQTEEDWQRLLELGPEGCFVISQGDVVAASATVVLYGTDLAWIGMVLTLPEFRKQGLASRLIERLSMNLRRVLPAVTLYQPRQFEPGLTVRRPLAIANQAFFPALPLSPFQFRLPPPLG